MTHEHIAQRLMRLATIAEDAVDIAPTASEVDALVLTAQVCLREASSALERGEAIRRRYFAEGVNRDRIAPETEDEADGETNQS